jgi:hypothetical protein
MKRLLFLALALAVSVPALAPASTCTDACDRHFRQQLGICSSTYAGDSELIFLCSQEAQAEHDECIAGCG